MNFIKRLIKQISKTTMLMRSRMLTIAKVDKHISITVNGRRIDPNSSEGRQIIKDVGQTSDSIQHAVKEVADSMEKLITDIKSNLK